MAISHSQSHFIFSHESLEAMIDSPTLWDNLKNKDDPDLQISAALEFAQILNSVSLSEEEWNYVLSSVLDERMKGCVFSTFPHEIIGGILLISELIYLIEMHELQEFFSRYAMYLREILLKCNLHDDRYKSQTISVIALCTQTLGHLVPLSGNYAKRIVESHIKQALKWIQSAYNKTTCCEQHKIAAVWLLSEYAVSVPILFNVHINEIIAALVEAMRDKVELVRIGGCRVLNECLKLIGDRPHRDQTSLSSRIITDGYQGLLNNHSSKLVVKHGSLLTFECILNYCIANNEYSGYTLITKDFEKICRLALKEKDNRKPMIKLSVIRLLPLFADYQTSKFIKCNFLDQSLSYLITTLIDTNAKAVHHNAKQHIKQFRNESFKSIGKIAMIVGPKMIRSKKSELDQQKALKTLGRMLSATKNQSQLTKIIQIMQESFDLAINRKQEGKSYGKYIKYPLKCLSMLANALRSELAIFLNHKLILTIFDLGLTKQILKCIQNVYTHVITFQPLIQDRLSRICWSILLYNMDPIKYKEINKQINNNLYDINNTDNDEEAEQKMDTEYTNNDTEYTSNDVVNGTMDDTANNIMYYHYKYNAISHINQDIFNNMNDINDIPPFVSPPITNKYAQGQQILSNTNHPLSSPLPSTILNRKPSDVYEYEDHSVSSNQHSVDQSRRRSSVVRESTRSNHIHTTEPCHSGDTNRDKNNKLIELALQTMSSFNLHDVNINLLYFVQETVLFYCNHKSVCIRKQAGVTCCDLLVRIIEQMEKESNHLKQHWIEMHNTHSTKPHGLEPNNSGLSALSTGLFNMASFDKSATSTPQQGAPGFPQSPLWALSYPSLPLMDSQPATPNIYGFKPTSNLTYSMAKSIPIPSSMYDVERERHNKDIKGDIPCDGVHMQLSGQHKHQSQIICNILAKLLSLAIADIQTEVREQLLLSLLENDEFYPYLAQQQLLPSLFIALNDEYFGVREIALKLLGILATYNPAHIMPFIRKNLLELLTYLDNEQNQDVNNRQQSAELIGDLIESASTETMKLYVNRIMVVLLRQLKIGDNIQVEISILRTIGKLANVAQQSLIQYFNKFLPILVSTLSKTSVLIDSKKKGSKNNMNANYKKSGGINGTRNNDIQPLITKKCVALQTLGKVIESTGLVIQPYLLYKKLLKIILDSLKADQHLVVRREAIQILGIIGALDPHIHKTNMKQIEMQEKLQKKMDKNKSKIKKMIQQNTIQSDEQEKKPVKLTTDTINEDEFYDEDEADFLSESNILLITGSRDPQYYAYVVLRSLILIVDNPSLHEYHREALSNIMKIFDNLGTECISYLQNVIPPIVSNLKKFNNAGHRAMLLQQLARLIRIVKSHIRTYLTQIFELIHNLWDYNAYSLVLLKAIKHGGAKHTHKVVSKQIPSPRSVHPQYDQYHPYYNHPSSYMVPVSRPTAPVRSPNLKQMDVNNSLGLTDHHNYAPLTNLFMETHHRNRSDSFGIPPVPSLLSLGSSGPSALMMATSQHSDNPADRTEEHPIRSPVINTAPNIQNADVKTQVELQDQLLLVMIQICRAIQDEFQQYLHRLLPKLLLVLQSRNERSTISCLNALTIFGNNLQQFLFLVLPPIMELIQSQDVSLLIRIKSIECVGRLCTKCDLNAYTSRIIHPLIHILNTYGPKVDIGLFNATMGTLCLMMIKMGQDFLIFASMITRTLNKCKLHHSQYHNLLHSLINHGVHAVSYNNINKFTDKLFDDKLLLASSSLQKQLANATLDTKNGYHRGSILSRQGSIDNTDDGDHNDGKNKPEHKKTAKSIAPDVDKTDPNNKELKVAGVMLSKAWDITGRAAERDWFAWLHGFQCELLSQNPRKELRVCSGLAQKYKGLATDLFNASFLSCWMELDDKFQHDCRRALMSALQKTKLVPAKVKKILLGLVEFMERQNHSIWIDIPVLANVAELSHSFPNALYYKEREFRLSCLVLNSQLQHHGTHQHHHHGRRENDLYNGYGFKPHKALKHPHSRRLDANPRYHHSNNVDVSRINAKFNTSYSITAESLLRINNQLQQNEAAEGILQYTQMHKPEINIKPTWFEKLNRWEEALDAYSKMHLECPPNDLNANITANLGRMRCLKALGEWQRLYKLATDSFSDIRLELDRLNNSNRLHHMLTNNDPNNIKYISFTDSEMDTSDLNGYKSSKRQYRDSLSLRNEKGGPSRPPRHQRVRSGFNAKMAASAKAQKPQRHIKQPDAKKDTEATLIQFERDVAPLGAMACWNLGFWDKMKHFVKKINANNNFDGAFLRSIISVHENNSNDALYWIEKCREFLDLEFTSIIVDDYENMYPLAVKAQQLVELEEILLYKDAKAHKDNTKCRELQKMWKQRLNFVSHSVEVWQSILSIRQLVIAPKDDVDTWLKFTSLCRKSNRLSMSLKIIANLMGYPNENILFYHQMYYDNDNKGSNHDNNGSNFVKWAPSLRRSGSASQLHGFMNDTLKFPLGVRRVQERDVTQFTMYLQKSYDLSPHTMRVTTPITPSQNHKPEAESVDNKLNIPNSPSVGMNDGVANIKYFHEYKEDDFDIKEEAAQQDKDPSTFNIYRDAQPNVAFSYAKHLSSAGLKNQAFAQLSGLLEFMENFFDYSGKNKQFTSHETNDYYYHHLTASCYLRLGKLKNESDDKDIDEVLECYRRAICHDPKSFYSWHAWALMNYQAIQHYEDKARNKRRKGGGIESIDAKLIKIIPAAVDALFESIKLSVTNSKLQDVLRLLYLLFRYGDLPEVSLSLQGGFASISINTWLSVIPQIIARLHIGKLKIRSLIHALLVNIGRVHPQSLIFPLTVASKSPNITRKKFAKSLLDKIRLKHPVLVEEGEMISEELLRVAILWHEMWYEALIEASRLLWGKQRNVNAMILRLKPLYALMHDDATEKTLRERAFEDSYRKDLEDAWRLVEQYQQSKNEHDLVRAFEYYRKVYNKIDHEVDKLSDLELQYVSPSLFNANNLRIVMPGTYCGNEDNVNIFKFNQSMTVFVGTAQRPRKLTILGCDGNNYTFLLKGREDLRQDERVMQLFGLINRLLKSNNETNKRDLEIRTYAVIPLAPNCGMIGWVSFTDTIHQLIETYRESQQLIFGIEHAFVKEEFEDYDMLPTVNKLEIFKYVLNVTKGNDLRDLFWLKSWNSEIWLKKRCEYMRSLGVMAMVGYVLGLGDRHPCNLMIHRYTGKVVHIDFGDCFEVAMLRDKLPEKVPFRLTRMLINAMEISGFEGNFRINCQSVMHLLREHKESVMAVLEALAYDPLMNWRLLEQQEKEKEKEENEKEQKKKKKKKSKLKLDNTSSNSCSSNDTVTTSPLTPMNSTTNHTPELDLGVDAAATFADIDDSSGAGVATIDAEISPAREMRKTKSVRFQDVNEFKEALAAAPSKESREKPSKLPPQIHQIHAASLRAKKSRSFASSLRMNDDEMVVDDDNNASDQSRKSTLTMSYSRRHRLSSLWMPREMDDTDSRDNVNKKALQVLQRVNMKLKGRDFIENNAKQNEILNVKEQVQRLFIEATNHENLSQAYLGWCPLW